MNGEQFSISAIGRMLGRDRSTIARAIKKAGLTGTDGPGREKLFNLPEVLAVLPAHLIGHAHDEAALDLQQESARLKRLQADRVAHDLALAQGDVLASCDVERVWSDLSLRMRARMLAIPHQAPALVGLPAREIQAILTQAVEAALLELSEYRGPDGLEVSSDG